MKTRLNILLFLFLLCCCTLAAQEKELHILHTSDTHSRVEPIETTSAEPEAGMGGMLRRTALVSAYRTAHPDALLFDCGDIGQGTLYYNLFQGEVEVKLMNLMGYDAMTIGNHEFDCGMENMARLFRMAAFPVVCANYDFTGTPLEGIVKPYTVLERDGLRIGVFGLGPALEGLVQADKYQGVTYHEPEEVAQAVVDTLREQERCDVVVCLSHLGISMRDDNVGDRRLVACTTGIDLVLGGHSHTFMERPLYCTNAEGKSIPVLHTGKNGAYVGEMRLTLSPQ
ncbi:MAG: metallophosphatase [Prevotellaceae bacterium]|nr:metallophosphatase [Prevotellaceae bacterium]